MRGIVANTCKQQNMPTHPQDSVSLRDRTEDDDAFLFSLFLETAARQFSHLALPEQQMLTLLEMQFKAREQGWKNQHPEGLFQIILVGDETAGYWVTGETEGEPLIVYLGLLPSHQGRGIAGYLTKLFLGETKARKKQVTIHVEVGNPAREFWEHMGFHEAGRSGVYLRMRSK